MSYRIISDEYIDFTESDLTKDYVWSLHKHNRENYLEAFAGADEIYVITVSSKLSFAYQEACIAREMYLDAIPETKIAIIDSMCIAAGEYIVFQELERLCLAGKSFNDVVAGTKKFINHTQTICVLGHLGRFKDKEKTLKHRLSLTERFNKKAILFEDHGRFSILAAEENMEQALRRMLGVIKKKISSLPKPGYVLSYAPEAKKEAVITCLEAKDKVQKVSRLLQEKFGFSKVTIIEAKNQHTQFAAEDGMIIAYHVA